MEKEYYDAQVKYINELRSIRHDIQAHMIVLQYYLESENYEKAKSYLYDMKKEQDCRAIIVKDTGHDLVNAIVSDTLCCSKKKIDFQVEGMFPSDFGMTEYDVCTLFSNLFSNAREACEKLKGSVPVISMEIQESQEGCTIALQNPIEWDVKIGESGLLTTKAKKELHGFGTKNVMKVVKKYRGKIDFLITEHYLRVEIILPKIEKK